MDFLPFKTSTIKIVNYDVSFSRLPTSGSRCINFLTADKYTIIIATKLILNSGIFLISEILILAFKFELMCNIR